MTIDGNKIRRLLKNRKLLIIISKIFVKICYILFGFHWHSLRALSLRFPWDEGPPDGSEVSMLKIFKVLENETIFEKYQHFFLPKHPILLRKISNIVHILQEFIIFFQKSFLRDPINQKKFTIHSMIN